MLAYNAWCQDHACVPAGIDGTGASREGAEAQPYRREEEVRPGGVSEVEPGRWAASVHGRDTGLVLEVGTCVPPHRL